MKILIVQMKMHQSEMENVQEILSIIGKAGCGNIDICVFPELVITGFRGDMVTKATNTGTKRLINTISSLCKEKSVAVLVGSVLFENNYIYNACIYIDKSGKIQGSIIKNGLTESEKAVFSSKVRRPVFELNGVKFSSIICREIEDHSLINFESSPDIIFWPSYVGEDENDIQANLKQDHFEKHAAKFCKKHDAFIVQANWGETQRPEVSLCGSIVLDNKGKIIKSLPGNVSMVCDFCFIPDSIRNKHTAI